MHLAFHTHFSASSCDIWFEAACYHFYYFLSAIKEAPHHSRPGNWPCSRPRLDTMSHRAPPPSFQDIAEGFACRAGEDDICSLRHCRSPLYARIYIGRGLSSRRHYRFSTCSNRAITIRSPRPPMAARARHRLKLATAWPPRRRGFIDEHVNINSHRLAGCWRCWRYVTNTSSRTRFSHSQLFRRSYQMLQLGRGIEPIFISLSWPSPPRADRWFRFPFGLPYATFSLNFCVPIITLFALAIQLSMRIAADTITRMRADASIYFSGRCTTLRII